MPGFPKLSCTKINFLLHFPKFCFVLFSGTSIWVLRWPDFQGFLGSGKWLLWLWGSAQGPCVPEHLVRTTDLRVYPCQQQRFAFKSPSRKCRSSGCDLLACGVCRFLPRAVAGVASPIPSATWDSPTESQGSCTKLLSDLDASYRFEGCRLLFPWEQR